MYHLNQVNVTSCDLDIALGYIEIQIILQLTLQPYRGVPFKLILSASGKHNVYPIFCHRGGACCAHSRDFIV